MELHIDLKRLRYFVAVADDMSFTKAAQKLRIAQPPLSQQIQHLEGELGFPLFDRSNRRGLRLTADGRDFLAEARQVLAGLHALEKKIQLRSQGLVGSLSVGLISSMATTKFATMLREFQKTHPGIQIRLIDRPSSWQFKAFSEGKLDVGFVRPLRQPPKELVFQRIRKQAMKLAVPTGHPLAKKSQVEWRDLSQEDFILVEPEIVSATYYSEFELRCQKAGFTPRVSQYTTSMAAQIWLVSAGFGLAPLSVASEVDRWPGVAFVTLPKDAPVYETAVVWRKENQTAAVMKFIEFTRGFWAEV